MKKDTSYFYQTAYLRVYPRLGQVQRQLENIRLGPINMHVLTTLLDRPGQVVSRNELFEQVWKNQIISDDTLTRCISDLRTLLGHHQTNSPLIQTIPKRGYRWLPDVQLIHGTKEDDAMQAPAFEDGAATTNETVGITAIGSAIPDETTAQTFIDLPTKATEVIVPVKTRYFPWRSLIQWGALSLVLLLAMTYTSIWIARNAAQTHFVSIVLLPSHASSPDLESIGIEIDRNLKQHILGSKHLRYVSQRVVNHQSLADIIGISHQFGVKWIIESQISHQNQILGVSFSLVDSRSSLVLYEKSRNFPDEKNRRWEDKKRDELEAFSKEFIVQAEQLMKIN